MTAVTADPPGPASEDREPPDLSFTSRLRRRRVRVPTVLQMEIVECGAACLAMVMAHFGRWEPLTDLRVACGVSRDGANALGIVRAARRRGIKAEGHSRELDELATGRFPVIAYWAFGHFVVVEGASRAGLNLNDPATGRRLASWDEADRLFTGLTIELEPTSAFKRLGRQTSARETLLTMLTGSWGALGLVVLAGFLIVFTGLAPALSTQVFINQVIADERTGPLAVLIVVAVLATVAGAVLLYVQQRVLLRMQLKLTLVTTDRLLHHLLQLPVQFFAARPAGDLTYRMNLAGQIASLLSNQIAPVVIAALSAVLFLAVMFWLSPALAVVALAAGVAQGVALFSVQRMQRERSQQATAQEALMRGAALEGIRTLRNVKAAGADEELFTRVAGMHARVVNTAQRLQTPTTVLAQVPVFAGTVATTLVLLVGANLAFAGNLSPAKLVAFTLLLAQFLAPIGTLVTLGSTLQTMRGAIDRLEDVLRHPPDPAFARVLEVGGDSAGPIEELRGSVALRRVTFGYTADRPPLIRGLDLEVPVGGRIALVGRSGSGKSTVVGLVAGLLQPWDGAVELDGVDRRDLPRSRIARSLAVVDQHIVLFAGTVRSNLTLWDPYVPENVVEAAIADAELMDVLRNRPGYLDASVDEGGANFSGGQRQRMELARALVLEPSILVLDEASSALDPVTERRIEANLRRRGCTTIVAAHRLSTVRDADEILVMSRGKIVERGTHDELAANEGLYSRLLSEEDPG